MKTKKIIKYLVVLMCVFSLTGCVKYAKNGKKTYSNEKTGQRIVSNIICQPTNKDTLKLYDKYNKDVKKSKKINIEKLPKCKKLKLTDKYDGIWTSVFVKPLAWLIIQIGNLIKSYGLALILATVFIRLLVFPFTKKVALQSENMKKAQPELAKLEKKYKNKNDQQSMMQKSQEMMFIYKKYNINPMSSCLFSFIQIPLFFAFYEAILRIPIIFEEKFIGFDLGLSPLNAVQHGDYKYLIFIVLISASTYFSFKLNDVGASNPEQKKQMKTMSIFMTIFMTWMSFTISTGIAFYWLTTSIFTIGQKLYVKRGIKNTKNK